MEYTVKQKPHSLYNWSNYNLMDFYCSFHDDDENESFKSKLETHIDLFASEYQLSSLIRANFAYSNQTWFTDTIISFCCVMDDKEYEQHSYNAIMSVISRTMRVQHIKQNSSKQSILRNSMHLHLGIDFIDNRSNSHNNSSGSLPNEESDNIIVRKWSNDSNQSGGNASSYKHSYKDTGFTTIDEEKEHNDGYQGVDDESKNSSVYINFKQIVDAHKLEIEQQRNLAQENGIEEEKEMDKNGEYRYLGNAQASDDEDNDGTQIRMEDEEDSMNNDLPNQEDNKLNIDNYSNAKLEIAITPAETSQNNHSHLHDMLRQHNK